MLLATAFAQTEWQEFTSRDGNFRVLFPDHPQEQTLTERNPHQFTATVGGESYGVAYADYPADTAWENVVDAGRDSIVKDLAGSVVDEKRTFVEGNPGKFVRFVGQNTNRELIRSATLVCAARFAPKRAPGPENFSTLTGQADPHPEAGSFRAKRTGRAESPALLVVPTAV